MSLTTGITNAEWEDRVSIIGKRRKGGREGGMVGWWDEEGGRKGGRKGGMVG